MSAAQYARLWTIQSAPAAARCQVANTSGFALSARMAAGTSKTRISYRPLGTTSRRCAKVTPKSQTSVHQAPPKRQEQHTKKTRGSAPPHDNRQTLSELLSQRKTPLVAAGLAAMVIGGYIAMLVVSAINGPREDEGDVPVVDCEDCVPTGRPLDVRMGRISAMVFDQELNATEGRIGIKGLRKLMGGLARGHVLEVAVGTGRNVAFIDWDEIKATAPLVEGEDGDVVGARELHSEKELERMRVKRRMEKGKKGMVLPGDEAPEVLSYTGVDVSTDVLEVTWTKLKKAVPELIPKRRRKSSEEQGKQATPAPTTPQQPTHPITTVPNSQPNTPEHALAANIGHGRIRLYKADATQGTLPPAPALTSHDGQRTLAAPAHYDTILQNFGLCSVGSPQRLLAAMAQALQPGTGRIYLLEHGRSGSHGWLDALLDRFAPSHFRRYGCWWNRDIEAVVRAAEKDVPGLEVVRMERPLPWRQGGTLLWIELRVNPDKKRD